MKFWTYGGWRSRQRFGSSSIEQREDLVRRSPQLASARQRAADEPVGRLPAPLQLQLAEVARVDLRQRRILGVAEITAVRAPLAFGAGALLPLEWPESRGEQETDDRNVYTDPVDVYADPVDV